MLALREGTEQGTQPWPCSLTLTGFHGCTCSPASENVATETGRNQAAREAGLAAAWQPLWVQGLGCREVCSGQPENPFPQHRVRNRTERSHVNYVRRPTCIKCEKQLVYEEERNQADNISGSPTPLATEDPGCATTQKLKALGHVQGWPQRWPEGGTQEQLFEFILDSSSST